jgi:putative transposase
LHVAGAIPPQAFARIRQEAARLRSTEATERMTRIRWIFRNMESWLDRDTPSPLLTHPQVAALLREALETRAARGDWNLLHWVIMPSHLHVLYVSGNIGMRRLMADFKRWTGHGATKVLEKTGAAFSQSEWFDHWSRRADETERMATYIRNNPVRAGLVRTPEEWPHGSWS